MIPARRRACLAAWALLLASSACPAPARPPEPGALRLNLGTEPATLDWTLANDSVSFDVVGNLMDGLTRLGEDGRIEPALAERWTLSEDGLRLTFHLRDGARWTDGRPLAASDFVYAWRRLLAPATGAVYAYILHPIRGARAFNEGRETDPESVGVRAPDARTLEVEFERPASYFPGVTTFMAAFPAPRWAIEAHGDRWTEPGAIVTLGAFALAAWRHDDEIDLRANPDYWGGAPRLRRVEMAMVEEASTALALFETGRLDFVDYRSLPVALLPRYIAGPGHLASPQLRTNYLGFNVTKPPFDDRRVRAAFALALRREVIPRVLRGGETPLRSLIPPGLLGHDPGIGLPEDAGRARALLAEAGFPGGEGFPPVALAYNTREDWRTLLEAVQAIWAKELGVRVRLENQEWKTYLETLRVDPPHLYRLGWQADYPDPHNFMELFASTSGNNYTRWESPEYDRLVEEASRIEDPERRRALYAEAQRLLLERDVAIIPTHASTMHYVVRPAVRGLAPNPMGTLRLAPVDVVSQAAVAP